LSGDGEDEGVDFACAGGFEGSGAFVQGGAGGFDVVDQTDGFAGEGVVLSHGEGAGDISVAGGGRGGGPEDGNWRRRPQ